MSDPSNTPTVIHASPPAITSAHAEDQSREHAASEKKASSSSILTSQKALLQIAATQGVDSRFNGTELKPIEERIQHREKLLAQQRLRNLEAIFYLAFKTSQDEVAQLPDPTWLNRFVQYAENISGASMQSLWAQMLKREVIQPGTISFKALSTLHNMSRAEAKVLQQAASLASAFGNDGSLKLITSLRCTSQKFTLFRRPIRQQNLQLGQYALPYSSLLVLFDLGLLLSTELASGEFNTQAPTPLQYQGKQWQLRASEPGLTLIYYRFSPTGNELCQLLGKKENNDYQRDLLSLLGQKFFVEETAAS
uniref:TIGR03899 family protein n=1 Tax=Thaumasiovibrio occultus TaxID=1891184 RepID=UPI000B35B1FE|nr:TIGR03899 family protein [Thaumasiovibrio occultus]